MRCALPVGLAIVVGFGKLPRGVWWWRILVLGVLNIGLFFALLFVAAYRLPGEVAATLGAVQPLLVAGLASVILAQRLTLLTLMSGFVGVLGVALLVLGSALQLELWGLLAALGGAFSIAAGTVLTRFWPRPVPVLLFTGWQLVVGGALLGALSFVFEGPVPTLSARNVVGYGYLGLLGAGLAYALWFRGIQRLGTAVSFLGLLSPVVATGLGYLVLEQRLSWFQGLGAVLVLGSVLAGQLETLKSKSLEPVATEPVPTARAAARSSARAGSGRDSPG